MRPLRPSTSVRPGVRRLSCLLIGTVVAVAVSVPAHAADELAWDWQGETVSLDWHGDEYVVVTSSFVGQPVAVPGDYTRGTINVRNDGPDAAMAIVEIYDAETVTPDGTANADLENLIHLRSAVAGEVNAAPFAAFAAVEDTTIGSVHVEAGDAFPVTIGYHFPTSATTGIRNGSPSTRLTFRVRITMTEEAPGGETTPAPKPTKPRGGAIPGPAADRPDSSAGRLPVTGIELAGLAGAAILILAAGWFLVAAARRRRRTDDPA